MSVPIEDQIRCVKREISFRFAVYRRRVEEGKMLQSESDKEISTMRAVLETLETVAKQNSRQRDLL